MVFSRGEIGATLPPHSPRPGNSSHSLTPQKGLQHLLRPDGEPAGGLQPGARASHRQEGVSQVNGKRHLPVMKERFKGCEKHEPSELTPAGLKQILAGELELSPGNEGGSGRRRPVLQATAHPTLQGLEAGAWGLAA